MKDLDWEDLPILRRAWYSGLNKRNNGVPVVRGPIDKRADIGIAYTDIPRSGRCFEIINGKWRLCRETLLEYKAYARANNIPGGHESAPKRKSRR